MLPKLIRLTQLAGKSQTSTFIEELILSRSMATRIAWRNVFFDKIRFGVTVVGVVFATILIGVEVGFLAGFVGTTSALIDHSKADLWISGYGARSFDTVIPIDYDNRFQALASSRVALAEPYFLQFAYWKRHDGAREIITIVGVEPDAKMGLPWKMENGEDARAALAVPDGVLIDRLYAEKLGVHAIGETVEINEKRARVTGFTNGVRTFTQAPYVFTSLKNAQNIIKTPQSVIAYVLISLKEGENPRAAAHEISKRLPNADVMTTSEFAMRSQKYWLLTTGAGATLVGSAFLAFVVGCVVVAQTLYASTVERMTEYAAIRAMGAPREFLYKIVVQQALIAGLIGYAIGLMAILTIVWLMEASSAVVIITPITATTLAVIDALMCGLAALISIRRLMRIDPVRVFR